MTVSNTRAGIAQAKHNESATWIVGLDMVVAGIAAYIVSKNGLAAVGAGLGAGVLTMIPKVGLAFGALMSCLYGWAGFGITRSLENSDGASVAVGIVVGLIALGLHLAAHQHSLDLGAK